VPPALSTGSLAQAGRSRAPTRRKERRVFMVHLTDGTNGTVAGMSGGYAERRRRV
jgi:hypothetical protein